MQTAWPRSQPDEEIRADWDSWRTPVQNFGCRKGHARGPAAFTTTISLKKAESGSDRQHAGLSRVAEEQFNAGDAFVIQYIVDVLRQIGADRLGRDRHARRPLPNQR